MDAQAIIDHFGMVPLPEEGGWFVETYRASESIAAAGLDVRYGADRDHSTAILYLITADCVSRMHRVKSDEIFHYHLGDPVQMLQLWPGGEARQAVIGPDILNGQQVQVTVPHGVWQGSRLVAGGAWCLMSCTVSPGFEYDDYEHGDKFELIEQWPQCRAEIDLLT
ncbi:MAG: cupin domain-containing protein [Planctomycetota bacterium]|jgi:predicted cupin superfamily sugar epimerase